MVHRKDLFQWEDRETWLVYIEFALNANVAVFLWFPQIKKESTGPPCDRTEHWGVHWRVSLTTKTLSNQIIASKNNVYKCIITEREKDKLVFFWIPYTIFIKVHLSAISLPRKQLSIENSACCFLSLVFVPSRYSLYLSVLLGAG